MQRVSRKGRNVVLCSRLTPVVRSKTVGAAGAIDAILRATYQALDSLDPSIVGNVAQAGENGVRPLKFRHRIFKKVWLGLAGIGHQADVDAFAPHALEALCLEPEDNALRITNGSTAPSSSPFVR